MWTKQIKYKSECFLYEITIIIKNTACQNENIISPTNDSKLFVDRLLFFNKVLCGFKFAQ